jgi:c-di-GMP-binding flagellar brake protein YcgR
VKNGEKETKPRYGTVNFEKRKHPRFSVDLPIEYYRMDSSIGHTGRAFNASEGGLLLYLTEQVEIGQYLKSNFPFTSGSEINSIEMLAEVAWIDIDLGEVWGDYRCGVKFIDISPVAMNNLKNFLRSLSG